MSKRRITMVCSLGKSLVHIATWKALRPAELGLIQFGAAPHGRKFAEASCRKLTEEGLLIARKLPLHAGQIFVLSRAGAELVSWWLDGKFSTGKDFGETKRGSEWMPPASWRHDLLATGLLAHLKARGWLVRPEIALRREVEIAEKHPDGLALGPDGKSYWVEVEQAEKKGKNMAKLVEALILAARARPVVSHDSWSSHPVNSALVAIDRGATDKRGYRISHLSRIEQAIQKRGLSAPVELTLAWLELKGAGVGAVQLEKKIINPAEK